MDQETQQALRKIPELFNKLMDRLDEQNALLKKLVNAVDRNTDTIKKDK